MSAYNPNIPQSSDNPKASQGQLLGNFSKLNGDFDKDHVKFNSTTNAGSHRKITLQDVLTTDPDLAAPLTSLYTLSVLGNPEVFFQNNTTAADAYQLTNLPVVSRNDATGDHYSIVTPWNLMLKMGNSAATGNLYAGPAYGGTIFTTVATGQTTDIRVSGNSPTLISWTGGGAAFYFVVGIP